MSADRGRLRLLHLHSSFNRGGKELRAVKLMNLFGTGIDHSVVSAVPRRAPPLPRSIPR